MSVNSNTSLSLSPVPGLWAIPAVHFKVSFASEVRRLCCDPATRPDAIAVELPAETATVVAAWIRELTERYGGRRRLPLVLGLSRECTRHKDVDSAELLVLSPTDSIIEAIRCAIQLNVPLFGIDINDPRRDRIVSPLIEDTSSASGALAEYVGRNAGYAASEYEPENDDPRETMMAGRLKDLLARYPRVLFTCGLGHWTRISRLLTTRECQSRSAIAANGIVPTTVEAYRRVLIHPTKAAGYLDAMPHIATAYEAWRGRISDEPSTRGPAPDANHLFRTVSEAACRRYFTTEHQTNDIDRREQDFASRRDWERLLENTCTVRRLTAPTLAVAMETASATMTPRFCETLFAAFMDVRWATPKQHPALSVFGADLADGSETVSGTSYFWKNPGWPEQDRRRRAHSSAALGAGTSRILDPKSLFARLEFPRGRMRSWPPGDRLNALLAYRAAQLANAAAYDTVSSRFEGSWFGRVDVRRTLRAHVSGDRDLYLREEVRAHTSDRDNEPPWEPTLLLFDLHSNPECHFRFYYPVIIEPPDDLSPEDEIVVDRVTEYADDLISAISYEQYQQTPEGFPQDDMTLARLHAYLMYIPPHLTDPLDEARWLDSGGRECVATTPSHSFPAFTEAFRHNRGIDIQTSDWPDQMVRLGLAFANRRFVIAAPDGFHTDRHARAEAKARNVEISTIPLSHLPSDLVAQAMRFVTARPYPGDYHAYSSEVEYMCGGPATAYQNMIPRAWRYLGKRGTRAFN